MLSIGVFWPCSLFHCHINSVVNAVFVFIASLSALAPFAPMLLPACWWWCLLLAMSAIHPPFSLSCSLHRLSDWSVVFIFNASLSALAPSAPILLAACWCLLLAMPAIHPSSPLSSCSQQRCRSFVFSFAVFAPFASV